MPYWKKNKYHAKKCRCNQNHIHDSKFEAGYCNDLQLRLLAADIKDFETQKRFDLHTPDGKKVCAHYPDFLITKFDDTQYVDECKSKGTVTPLWKLKKALFQYEYPHIPYYVVWL
jgi:hypothetical protein